MTIETFEGQPEIDPEQLQAELRKLEEREKLIRLAASLVHEVKSKGISPVEYDPGRKRDWQIDLEEDLGLGNEDVETQNGSELGQVITRNNKVESPRRLDALNEIPVFDKKYYKNPEGQVYRSDLGREETLDATRQYEYPYGPKPEEYFEASKKSGGSAKARRPKSSVIHRVTKKLLQLLNISR